MILHRRVFLHGVLASASLLAFGATASAQNSSLAFPQWVAAFRSRALARGVSEKTYDSVIGGLKPDTSVYALQRSQPEFQEQTWQYLNRRVSDWRITAGKEVAKEHAVMLGKIEREYGVDRYLVLAIWGVESAYGDPGAAEIHAPGVSGACCAGLGRAAPPRLLGEGTAQRFGDR